MTNAAIHLTSIRHIRRRLLWLLTLTLAAC